MRQLLLTVLALSLGPFSAASDIIWIEGEDAARENMQEHGWYDSVIKAELSGNAWLSNFEGGEVPRAEFRFRSETGGEHALWLRANPIAAKMSIKLNDGDWRPVSFDKVEQQLNIASDGKPDLRFVGWLRFPEPLELEIGANKLAVRFESDNNRHGGLDCFVLSKEPFLPNGRLKPGEKTGLADPGTWAFEPERDAFSPESLLDLTKLNEKPAGKNGRVRRTEDGADFLDGAGHSLRFWAVNTHVQGSNDLAKLEEHARWLAKRGVNMVRHHGHLPPGRGSRLTDVNEVEIERVWKLVAAMKDQGIYTTISPYWASHTKIEPTWDLKDPGNGNLTGLIFFDTDLQAAYKGWLRALLEPVNPHTGISLARDPAVALFQIQNEDSLLFWTEQSIQGEQRRELGRQFGQWLTDQYGSIADAQKAWGGPAPAEGDALSEGIVMPHGIWHLTQDRSGALANRFADQLAFYTSLMADFNREIARFLREDLGYEGLVNAGNWRTADQAKLLDAERFAYAANDVIGVNRYFNGGSHENPTDERRAGYLISLGDTFDSRSALLQPGRFPLALRQVAGHPMIVSESAWVPPLRFQTEGPFLVAAYSALTGIDVFYWFSTSDIGFGPPMGKWQLSTPAQIGMFPAAALMFRQGYVEEARPVVQERRPLDMLWRREPPLLSEESGFDPNRDTVRPDPQKSVAASGTVTPFAYLVGPVTVAFDEKTVTSGSEVADLARFVDPAKKTVTSNTGQLTWDYGKGMATINAPKAQGATGHLVAAGPIDLATLRLESKNDYATLLAVSMDGADLDQSARVLVQIGTTARPHGWTTRERSDGGKEITSLGSSPWNIENTQIEMALKNAILTKATLLDPNGMAVSSLPLDREGHEIHLELPAESMYVLLTAD